MMSLLFPFLLLSACVSQEKYDALLERNETLEQQVDALQARIKRQSEAYDAILADLKPLVDKGVLKIQNTNGRVTIGMASDILFPSGSAELNENGKATLSEVSRLLSRHAAQHDFQVEGHTDNQPISTAQFPDNNFLGAARAINVMEYMLGQGFPKKRLSAATWGDAMPVSGNDSESGRAQNRRIELVLMPDLSDVGKAAKGGARGGKGGGKGGGKKKKN
jgi:chemotaxis protein MotB